MLQLVAMLVDRFIIRFWKRLRFFRRGVSDKFSLEIRKIYKVPEKAVKPRLKNQKAQRQLDPVYV